jgi:hypothetical protein
MITSAVVKSRLKFSLKVKNEVLSSHKNNMCHLFRYLTVTKMNIEKSEIESLDRCRKLIEEADRLISNFLEREVEGIKEASKDIDLVINEVSKIEEQKNAEIDDHTRYLGTELIKKIEKQRAKIMKYNLKLVANRLILLIVNRKIKKLESAARSLISYIDTEDKITEFLIGIPEQDEE